MSSEQALWTIDSNSSNSTNTTQTFPQPAGWTSLNVFGLLVILVGTSFNISLLAVFIKRRTLRNSFGVYLINLLVAEILFLLVFSPINLVDAYTHNWVFGYGLCWFQNYVGYTYETLIIFAHFFIALNRVWAVTFPFSYRTHHSTKFAILLCGSFFIVMHFFYILVALTTTVVTFGSTMYIHSCDVNPNDILYILPELGLFMSPMVFVILSYPYVCYKSFFSDRKQRIAPHVQMQEGVVAGSPQMAYPSATVGTLNTQGVGVPKTKLRVCGRELEGSATGFVTLSLMTLSVAVCLLPKESLFTYMIWFPNPPGLLAIFDVLQRLTTVFDPVLIAVGNTEIRAILLKQLHFKRC